MLPDDFHKHDVTVTLPADAAVSLFHFLYGCLYRPPTPPLASRKRYRYLTPAGPTPPDHNRRSAPATLADCVPCDRDGRLDPGFAASGYPVRIDDLGEPVGLLPHAFDADDL